MTPYRSALEAALEAMRKASTWIYYRRLAGGDPMSEEEELLFRAVAKCEETLRRTEQEHVAWCRYVFRHEKPPRIVLCDSDANGAFKVYAYQPEPEKPAARRLTADELKNALDQEDVPEEPPGYEGYDMAVCRAVESAIAAMWGVKLP